MPQVCQQERERLTRLMALFHPEAARRSPAIQQNRVVHYTSADCAMKIISTQTMWLRNTNCMSDYTEVELGFSYLRSFFDPAKTGLQRFIAALNGCYPGLGDEVISHVNQWMPEIRTNTYIASVSEHDAEKENDLGRLSMWRAFGQSATARAAIVMNVPDPFAAEGLHLTLLPVDYTDSAKVEARIEQVVREVTANIDFLQTFPRDRLKVVLFGFLTSIAVCSKHAGYREELEWRVIYLPNYWASEVVKASIQTIGGIPQIVHEVPLKEDPGHDVVGVGIPSLVERIIIGPSAYPVPMWMAFVNALKKAGMPNPEKRVVISNIPIRW